MPTSALLTYSIGSTPNLLTANYPDAVITLLATNLSPAPVPIQQLSIAILAGNSDADLTNDPDGIVPEAPETTWSVSKGRERAKYKFVFVAPASFVLGQGKALTFILKSIALNDVAATTTVTVTEDSGNQPSVSQDLTVSIWPEGWGIVDFWADETDLPAGGGGVTLNWNGPAQADYTIQYTDPSTQKIIIIDSSDNAALGNNGSYPSTGAPALSITANTVFTLSVKETINGIKYGSQPQVAITVAEGVPAITSFTGQVVYNNGVPTLELNWETSNVSNVTLNGSDVQLAPNTSTKTKSASPYLVSPPFATDYYITAYGPNNQSIQSANIQIGWAVSQTIPVNHGATNITITPNNTYALVVCHYSNTLQVIELNNFKIIAENDIGFDNSFGLSAWGVATIPNNTSTALIVKNMLNIGVLSLDSFEITQTLEVPAIPTMIAVKPDGKYAMVTSTGLNNVSLILLSNFSIVNKVAVGNSPSTVCFSPNGAYAYVVNQSDCTLSVIQMSDFTVVVQRIVISGVPNGAVVTSDGNYILVAVNSISGAVWVINTNDFTSTQIAVGNNPQAIALTPGGKFAMVTNTGDTTVSVISIADFTVCQTVEIGQSTNNIAIASNGNYALTTSYPGIVSVLSLTVL